MVMQHECTCAPSTQELCCCQTVILSVEDEAGQRIIMEDLLEAARGTDPGMCLASVTILNAYFARTRTDHSAHTRALLSGLIRLLNDANREVLNQSWDTINSITKVGVPRACKIQPCICEGDRRGTELKVGHTKLADCDLSVCPRVPTHRSWMRAASWP